LRRDDRGVSSVEFALVLPLLLMCLFGVIELGLAWYTKQVITNASREGARAGIVYTEPKLSQSEIQNVVQTYLNNAGFTQPVTITVSGAGGDSGEALTVTVNHDYQFNVLPGFVSSMVGNITIGSTTVMRHE
jgi:Flp pilus assembly protein TadG